MFQRAAGDWTRFRAELGLRGGDEIDLHFGKRDPRVQSYDEAMAEVAELVEAKLREAQTEGRPYLMFRHGGSTSRSGRTTARSVVRQFMRSKAATPFINRSQCIQHDTCFIAKLRLPH